MNKFPIEVFHIDDQKSINEISEVNGVSTGIVGSFMLNAVGFSLLNNYQISVTRQWIERSNFFTIFVGYSGTGKSPVFNNLFLPIKKLDLRLQETYKKKYSEYLKYKKALKKGGELYGITDEIELKLWCEKNFGDPIIPQDPPRKMDAIVETLTFEKLFKVLSVECNDGRALLIHYDEFLGFIKSLNQYRRGADEEILLKLFEYSGMKKSNVGDDASSFIDEMNVCIAGTTQPANLFEIITKDRIKNGYAFRFLFAFDQESDEKQLLRNVFTNMGLSINPYENYHEMMDHFLSGYECGVHRENLLLNADISLFLVNWKNKMNEKFLNNNVWGLTPQESIGALSKMDRLIFRLAIILNRMFRYHENDLNNLNLSVKDFEGAAELVNYFLNNLIEILNITAIPISKVFRAGEQEFYDSMPESFRYIEFVRQYAYYLKMSEETAKRRLKEWCQESPILIVKKKGGYYKKF